VAADLTMDVLVYTFGIIEHCQIMIIIMSLRFPE
jgi:hypothetical protein